MKVSLKMLKLYCYESWGCIIETIARYANLYDRKILSLSRFSLNFEVNFQHVSGGPQALNYFKQHVSSSSPQPLGTPGFKKCAVCRIRILLQPLLTNFYSGCFGSFSESWITKVFRLVVLQICYAGYVVVYFLHR